jgi:hypothetical protein
VIWKESEVLVLREKGQRVKDVIKNCGERLKHLARDIDSLPFVSWFWRFPEESCNGRGEWMLDYCTFSVVSISTSLKTCFPFDGKHHRQLFSASKQLEVTKSEIHMW